jgi:hypothetical protein
MPGKRPRRLFRDRPRAAPAVPNDLPKLLEWAARARPAPGEFYHLAVCHDTWCSHWSGARCDCDPEVMTMAERERREAEQNRRRTDRLMLIPRPPVR